MGVSFAYHTPSGQGANSCCSPNGTTVHIRWTLLIRAAGTLETMSKPAPSAGPHLPAPCSWCRRVRTARCPIRVLTVNAGTGSPHPHPERRSTAGARPGDNRQPTHPNSHPRRRRRSVGQHPAPLVLAKVTASGSALLGSCWVGQPRQRWRRGQLAGRCWSRNSSGVSTIRIDGTTSGRRTISVGWADLRTALLTANFEDFYSPALTC
jgi:hypothetical protein